MNAAPRLAMCAALLALAGCVREAAPAPTIRVTINDHAIRCEVADTDAERARGLGHRDHLPPDAGMLFVYPDSRERSFWMKDTTIPLSIAFLDADGVILNIETMAPLTLGSHTSAGPARFALEVNRGWFSARGIKPGDRVDGIVDGIADSRLPSAD